MKILLSALVIIGLAFLFKPKIAPVYSISATELPTVVAELYGLPVGEYGTWVVFMFHAPATSRQTDAVNLQYSVEHGSVGLDWVLLSPQNISDKERLIAFIRDKGFKVQELEENNVRYLRVVGSGIEQLGVSIITEFYGLAPNTTLRFHTEGFEWSRP